MEYDDDDDELLCHKFCYYGNIDKVVILSLPSGQSTRLILAVLSILIIPTPDELAGTAI
jgi:hypothetical protein